MRHALAIILFLAFAMPFAATSTIADVKSDARTYCAGEHATRPKRIESCIRYQLKSANRVGDLLQQHGNSAEVKQIYARCARHVQGAYNAINWRTIESCMNREIKHYAKFKRATAQGQQDEFSQGIIAFCRGKVAAEEGKAYHYHYYYLEQCQKAQSKAGYAVADIYRSIEEGSPERFAIDDCAEKYRTDAGTYDWNRVHRCAKYARRRHQR